MAYFKLSLLDYTKTTVQDNGLVKFLPSVISEFYSQSEEYASNKKTNLAEHKNSFCYTYDENLSLHTNAQKELTFSINRMVMKDTEWIENPYARYMVIGAQLLLEDTYHNQYFFTIKDLKYTFKTMNLVINVICQDTFSYQLTRQNDGYEITNDPESDDFIGAKNIDWWVMNKIVPECHIPYRYVPMDQGLYNVNGKLVFSNTIPTISDTSDPSAVKVIKAAIERTEENKDLFETFPFSGSGNAASILISLGDKMGLSLCTFEHSYDESGTSVDLSNHYVTYFWFEPAKHEKNSGLYYSPFDSVQNFSLSHSGSSLTTVMNVTSNTLNDGSLVTLLPELPNFILQSFNSNEWKKSKWNAAFFSEWIKGRIEHYRSDTQPESNSFRVWHGSYKNPNYQKTYKIGHSLKYSGFIKQPIASTKIAGPYYFENEYNEGASVLYMPVSTDETTRFICSTIYDHYRFITEKGNVSRIIIKDKNGNKHILSSDNETFSLGYFSETKTKTVGKNEYLMWIPLEEIPNWQGQEYTNFCLKINLNGPISGFNGGAEIQSEDIYLNWYREPTIEDITFAEVADQIPWLENKIIDFSYFYKHNILNKAEYSELLNIIYNDLRISNGLLLFYTKEYYAALHEKTKILADITNQFDVLGATFSADIVNPYATKRVITNLDSSSFAQSYNNIFTAKDLTKKTPLLNFDETYTSYINKYISAEQRFLKNIYNFRDYFNSPVSFFAASACLYRDTIRLIPPSEGNITEEDLNKTYENISISFKNGGTQTLNKDNVNDYYDSKTGEPYQSIYLESSLTDSDGTIRKTLSKPQLAYLNCKNWYDLYRAENIKGKQLVEQSIFSIYNGDNNYYRKAAKISIDKETYTLWKNKIAGGKELTIQATYSTADMQPSETTWGYEFSIEKDKDNSSVSNYFITCWKKYIENNKKPGNSDDWYLPSSITIGILNGGAITHTLVSKKPSSNSIVDGDNVYEEVYRKVTLQELKANYIVNNWSEDILKKTYYRNYSPDYTPFQKIRDAYIWKKVNNDPTIVNDDRPINIYKSLYSKDSNEKKEKIDFYANGVSQIPLKSFLYKDFRFKIATKTDGSNLEQYDIVNSDGKGLVDYILDEDNVKNPYDEYNYYEIPILSESNYESFYYVSKNKRDFTLNTSKVYSTYNLGSLYRSGEGSDTAGDLKKPYQLRGLTTFIAARTQNTLKNFSEWISNHIALTTSTKLSLDEETKTIISTNNNNYTFSSSDFDGISKNPGSGYVPLTVRGTTWYLHIRPKPGYCAYMENFIPSWDFLLEGSNDSGNGYSQSNNNYYPINYLDINNCFYKDSWYYIYNIKKPLTIDKADEISIENNYLNKSDKPIVSLIGYCNDNGILQIDDEDTLIRDENPFEVWYWNRDNKGIPRGEMRYFKFSKIIDFPLVNVVHELNSPKEDVLSYSIQDLVLANGDIFVDANNDWKNSPIKNTVRLSSWLSNYKFYCLIGADCDYTESSIFDAIPKDSNLVKWLETSPSLDKIFDEKNAVVDFTKKPGFVNGFYTISTLDFGSLDKTEEDRKIKPYDENAHYYDDEGNRYYTLPQLIGKAEKTGSRVIVESASSYSVESLDPSSTSITAEVQLIKTTYQYRNRKLYGINAYEDSEVGDLIKYKIAKTNSGGDPKIISGKVEGKTTSGFKIRFSEEVPNGYGYYKLASTSIETYKELPDPEMTIEKVIIKKEVLSNEDKSPQKITFTIKTAKEKGNGSAYSLDNALTALKGRGYSFTWSGNVIKNIGQCTNGEFWYLFHDDIDNTVLFGYAATVESQLEQYWQSAYNASNYCEWFLPEHWQPSVDGSSNYFSDNVLHIWTEDKDDDKHTTITKCDIKSTFVPLVEKFRNKSTGKYLNTKYEIKYFSDIITLRKNQGSSNYPLANEVYSDNPAMEAIAKNLNIDWSNFTAEENGTTTYYYTVSGGTRHSALLATLGISSSHNFPNYDGLYIMYIKWLNKYYSSYPLTNYMNAKDNHDNIWQNIYRKYPSIILESKFSDEDATTSKDLLLLAQNAFKDKSMPERGYNISLINNIDQFYGYKGQELKIGDSIRLKANEFYDGFDDISNSLNQLLFITDIKYNLRKDTDINLTVNAIKYQDKLIQRLVKLIQ